MLIDILNLKESGTNINELYQKYNDIKYKQRAFCSGYMKKTMIDKLLNIEQNDFVIITDNKHSSRELVTALFCNQQLLLGKNKRRISPI